MKRIGRAIGPIVLLLGLLLPISHVVYALTDNQTNLYNSGVYYFDAESSGDTVSFCLGGPGGSGPLYGPTFPKISDTAALSAATKNYISTALPSSPLSSYSDAFVAYGLKYNVNPAMVVAMAQKETSLGTAGNGTPSGGYNVTNIRSLSGGFARYSGYPQGIEATYQNLRSGLYLDPPANYTTISQVINTWAPPSDNNDTQGYIQFVGDVMKKIFSELKGLPADVTTDSCTSGSTVSGPVDEGSNAQLAQKILSYRSTGQYNCDNSGDCTDLEKIVAGQSLYGSSGCQAQTLDPRVLQLILYIIEVGKFKVGTFALCGDHHFDGLGGHSGGLAVDISSVNGVAIGSDVTQAGIEGQKMDKFLNSLPASLQLDQQISYGYGGHYFAPMAALQQFGGQLCGSACVSDYGLTTELQHENHIHAGY